MINDEFSDRTLANMEVALARACEKLPADVDGHPVRKYIGERIVECAQAGKVSLEELTRIAAKAAGDYIATLRS